jgi:type III secretory pathway component EscU
VNAGAVVALLAFVGQLWDSKDINATVTLVAIFSKVTPFTYGLIFAVAGASVAYFYQSFATATFDHALKKISAGGDAVPPQKVLTVVTGLFAIVMIGLVIASFIFFGIGTLGVKAALGA